MIPRTDVEVSWGVDYPSLRSASADDIAHGGFATRGYAGVIVVEATWDEAAARLTHERETVARVAARAHDPDQFDELAKEEEAEVTLWDPEEGPVAPPDLGMFAACVALCAAGCATAASCRGHPGLHAWSSEPVILFTADSARTHIVEQAARATGCGLASHDSRLRLWAQSIEDVLEFAVALIGRQPQFDALPLPVALRDARCGFDEPPPPSPGQATLF